MSNAIEEVVYKYQKTYYKFPQALKLFLGSIYGNIPLSVRFGKTYTLHKELVEKFESSSNQYQIDFLYNKTLETLIFAELNIPYYKNLFQKHGVSSKDYKSLDDLKKFPTLTKQLIKNNLEDLYTNIIEKPVPYYSGGSLSTPTKYYLPQSSRSKEKAYNNYILSKIGYTYRDKTLLLKGREVSNPKKDIYWEYEPIDNYLLLSNNYMNSDKFPLMYNKVKSFNPKYIFGYPSAILSFMRQCKLHGYERLNIAGIILSSETIYPNELLDIKEFFNVDILTHYGHTERNTIGYQINKDGYHFLGSYGVTRILDKEIITTTFDNFVMPFINYKTGDHVTGNIKYYPHSDIAMYAENIEGRTQDFLVSKDKRLISITTMCGGQHLPLESINNIQYLQEEEGKVTVLVEGQNIDSKKVQDGMCKLVRDGIDFDVKIVRSIKKSTRNKRIICKQLLDIEAIRHETSKGDL